MGGNGDVSDDSLPQTQWRIYSRKVTCDKKKSPSGTRVDHLVSVHFKQHNITATDMYLHLKVHRPEHTITPKLISLLEANVFWPWTIKRFIRVLISTKTILLMYIGIISGGCSVGVIYHISKGALIHHFFWLNNLIDFSPKSTFSCKQQLHSWVWTDWRRNVCVLKHKTLKRWHFEFFGIYEASNNTGQETPNFFCDTPLQREHKYICSLAVWCGNFEKHNIFIE